MSPKWLQKRNQPATNGRKPTNDLDMDPDAAAEADQLRPDVEAQPRRPKNGISRLAETDGASATVTGRMREKLGLQGNWLLYVVAMVVLILLLLIAVIVLGVFLSGRRTFDDSQICLEPACLESSALLRGSVNTTISPCENVWEFSCGTWLANNPIPASRSKWGVFQQLRARALEQYRTIVNTLPQPLEADQLPWKMQNLYDSCMDLENINIDQARRLKDDIRALGGWAVLRNWNSNSFDQNHVLKKLHAEFRVEPFFSIRAVPDDANIGTNIIKIFPSGLGLPDRSYYDRAPDDPIVTAYRQFIQDTVKALGAQGPDANQFALNMYHLEKRIAEFTPAKQDIENPITTYNRISIRQLKNIATSVPWLEIIREIFPDAGIHQDTEVLVVSEKYVQDLSQLFFANDKTAMNNFLMWKLALKLVPYLSVEFRNVYELFVSDVTGAKEPKQRWEICTELLSEVFDHALGAMFHKMLKNPAEIMTTVEEIFQHLKDVLISNVESNGYLDTDAKSQGIEKIRQMKLQVGYPPIMRDSQHLEVEYQKLVVQKSDFYRNVVYGSKYQKEMDQEALMHPTEEHRWKDALQSEEPAYVYQANILVVPSYILQAPFFNGHFPRSYNYGSLGVLMAKAMVKAVDEIGIHYSPAGVLNVPGNSTIVSNHLEEPRRCLKAALKDLQVGTDEEVNRGANCSAIDSAGLHLGLRGLQASLEENEELPQPGLAFDPEGIFFASYAQMFCGESRPQQEEMDFIVSRCLPAETRLRVSLNQLDEFEDAFDCDGGDWSSSSKKCGRII